MQIKNILTILTINFLKYGPRMKLFQIVLAKKTCKVRKQSKSHSHGKIKTRKKESWIKPEVEIGP